MTARWIATPPTKEIASVAKNAPQNGKPWLTWSVQAMYVANIAISPWAKLMTPVERWMITSASAREA